MSPRLDEGIGLKTRRCYLLSSEDAAKTAPAYQLDASDKPRDTLSDIPRDNARDNTRAPPPHLQMPTVEEVPAPQVKGSVHCFPSSVGTMAHYLRALISPKPISF